MTSLRKLGRISASAAIVIAAGCAPSLDITNPNAPDVARALATPDDVKTLAISSINSWYLGSTAEDPYHFFQVTADVQTANYGNFGMRFNNLEPRIAYANNTTGNDRVVAQRPWDESYAALGAANDVLRALKGGIKLPGAATETDKYKHLAQFTQAAELMNLALIFDKSFPVDEDTDPSKAPEVKTYKEVSAVAVAKWQTLITATAGATNSYDPTVFPMTVGPLTSSRLNRIANTLAAATLAFTPRNAAEAATVNWAKVATFAAAGIGTGTAGAPFDVVVRGDNNTWFSNLAGYGNEPSWTRTDMRVINVMAPGSPAKYSGPTPKATSPDARFNSDYTFLGSVIGDPNRGIYMQSPYYHSRYEDHGAEAENPFATPVPYLLAAESDLLRAEALIRTNGDLALAATLINITRVGRGQLAPMTAASGSAVLLKAIEYERDVELTNTNGWSLFHRRHVDGLQVGTIRHLPIPAKELETLVQPLYTFGGPGKEMFVGTFGSEMSASRAFTFGESSSELELPTGERMTLHFPRRSVGPRSASKR